MFMFCDIDIHINTGRIWLERKRVVGLLRTRSQMFMFCDIDTGSINTGRILLERKGKFGLLWTGL